MTAPRTTASRPPAPRPTGWRRWRFLFTPFWIGAIVGSIAFALACWLILAPWQLGRHDDRQERNHTIENALQAPRTTPTEVMSADDQPTAGVWREVEATGTFLVEDEVAVRVRQDGNGNPASEMVLPFRLVDGTVLLVDRGYVADGVIWGGDWAEPPPSGQVTILGRVRADQPDPSNRPPTEQNGRVQVYGIDSVALLADVDATGPKLQGFVQLGSGSPGVLNPIVVPQLVSGPYQSYGWQWLAFGLIAVLAVGYFAVREGLDPREDDDRDTDLTPSGPPDTEAAGTGPVNAVVPTAPAEPSTTRERPRRGRFDKADLYDRTDLYDP